MAFFVKEVGQREESVFNTSLGESRVDVVIVWREFALAVPAQFQHVCCDVYREIWKRRIALNQS